jgi:hypothetical protein
MSHLCDQIDDANSLSSGQTVKKGLDVLQTVHLFYFEVGRFQQELQRHLD